MNSRKAKTCGPGGIDPQRTMYLSIKKQNKFLIKLWSQNLRNKPMVTKPTKIPQWVCIVVYL